MSDLTDRQERVLLLLAEGHGLREIARILGVSPHTVRVHRDDARRRLDARTTTHAVAIVLRRRDTSIA